MRRKPSPASNLGLDLLDDFARESPDVRRGANVPLDAPRESVACRGRRETKTSWLAHLGNVALNVEDGFGAGEFLKGSEGGEGSVFDLRASGGLGKGEPL